MKLLGKFKNNEIVEVYTTIKTAAETNEVSAPAISMSMKHDGKCKGATWKWIEVNSDVVLEAVKQEFI